jgi:hypothetical protein
MMEEITMSSSSLILAITLVGATCPGFAAPLAACPQLHYEGKHTAALENAGVFDGAPENLVDLMPDLETLEWDLSMAQRYARERGDSIYLVCKYKGIKSTVTLKLPPAAARCKVEEVKDRTIVWCGERQKPSSTNHR